jgi:hypothetical protein
LIYRSERFQVGRLAAVYNAAGKARIIGITNYWTQVALYPLHREIFKFIEGLPTDGTYNQMKPVKALNENGSNYYSYDLTAATDRLPRDIQRDVLELFIGKFLSRVWVQLMDMPFGKSKKGSVIHYAVGQPMGAYSSWAMLALTHHMIVQASGPSTVRNYAVLGDDVIVSDDAPDYLTTMTGFGVDISMAKSIISSEFVEFAKRIRTLKGEDYSILGPGLIMSAVRNRYLSAVVLADSLRKDLVSWTVAPQVLLETPGREMKRVRKTNHLKGKPSSRYVITNRTLLDFGCWVLFGPKGLISSNLSFALSQEGGVRVIEDLKHESVFFKTQIRRFLESRILKKWENAKNTASKVLAGRFYLTSWGRGWTIDILVYLTQWCSPIPWHIMSKYGEVLESVNPIEEKGYHKMYIDDIIFDALDDFPEMQISALEPLTRSEANNILSFYDGLLSYDHDAILLKQQEAARQEWLLKVEKFDRHKRLVAELASSRNAKANSSLHPSIRAHGHTVPLNCEDDLNGSSHFEIDFAIVDRVTFGEILFQQISQQVHFEILKFV